MPEARVLRQTSALTKLQGIELGAARDIGPAGPVAATAQGVVLVTKSGDVLTVPRTKLEPVTRPEADFAPLARSPAVADGFAYFVSQGKLVRRALDGGALEQLASNAQASSRVSAVAGRAGEPSAVAYVTAPNAEGVSSAKLWSAGRSATITPEGAGASSVALVRVKDAVVAVSIDGRSGMTPVHTRPVRLANHGPELGEDHVAWVGGSAQPQTEVFAASSGPNLLAFLAIEQDVSHFGLAELMLPANGKADAEVSWRLYANGLDMAPVAAAEVCGQLLLAYARPLEARPRAPQELVLSTSGSEVTALLGTATGFAAVSLAPAEGGGLLVYVADRRTFAQPISCR